MTEKEKKKESGEISRRDFLKDAGMVVGGAAIGSTVLLAACAGETETETVTETATKTTTATATGTTVTTTKTVTVEVPAELPKAVGHIDQVPWEESACTTCGLCELVCAVTHDGDAGPSLRRIWLDRKPFDAMYLVKTCLQCDDAPCYYACPYKDEALCIDSATGVRYINSDKCPPGCKLCIEACGALFDPPRINFDPERNVPVMCDLCKDREGGPACVEFCPAMRLILKERSV